MKISYIGVDVGGTFTDAVGMAVDGTTARAKASTTPQAHVDGILNSLDRLAEVAGLSPEALLAGAERVSVGTTVVTNAIAQMRGRRTGLLVTRASETRCVSRGRPGSRPSTRSPRHRCPS